MASSMGSHVTSALSYSNIHNNSEASTQELRLKYTGCPSVISFRFLASTSLLLGAATAFFILATSFGSSSSESLIEADGGNGFMTIGLAEAANGTYVGNSPQEKIRIKVCRNEDCNKHHPHGLVHEYTANLNKCAKIPEDTKKSNGGYMIIGATPLTLAEGTNLTAKQCGKQTDRVNHTPFYLVVGSFTNCCSFVHGGCGFKCITFKQS
mmetsp:Transcript_51396/g.99336  ORF Transcript_51396/g.99336 Transcript_51396/m.99336 type:complete len:209 (-) Transcript_51396:103-729(-)